MRQAITVDLLRRLATAPPARDTDIYDTHQPRLVLRARTTGRHTYRVILTRGQSYSLGPVEHFAAPAVARQLAQRLLGEHASGVDPRKARRPKDEPTVSQYLDRTYAPWLRAHRRSAADTAARIARFLNTGSGDLPLAALTSWHVERWRTERLRQGTRSTTVNRDIAAIKAMLNRAVEWGHLERSPLHRMKALREDRVGRLRYLAPEEERRLRHALDARDTERRTQRDSANAWRAARGYECWPAHTIYTDHVSPLVVVALNSGMRFGELTGLLWRDVDLQRRLLTIRGAEAKSGSTRYLPLNDEALAVLANWMPKAAEPGAFVFPGRGDTRLIDVKTAWAKLLERAQIRDFRFHDLRHTFASKLVMAGVDLNTVRELLGHADIKMTLRYAHLAPEHKAAAVNKLVAVR